MHNWRLLLLAFLAVLQPIASFTERNLIDGREQCCDRNSVLKDSRLPYGFRFTKLSEDLRLSRALVRGNQRYEVSKENAVLAHRSAVRRLVDFRSGSEERRFSPDLTARFIQGENRRETFTDNRRGRLSLLRDARERRVRDIHRISSLHVNRVLHARDVVRMRYSPESDIRQHDQDVREQSRIRASSIDNRFSRNIYNERKFRISMESRRETRRDNSEERRVQERRETREILQRARNDVASLEMYGAQQERRVRESGQERRERTDSRLQLDNNRERRSLNRRIREEVDEGRSRSMDVSRDNSRREVVARVAERLQRDDRRASTDRLMSARPESRDRTFDARRKSSLYERRQVREPSDRILDARESRDRNLNALTKARVSREETSKARRDVREFRDRTMDTRKEVRVSRDRNLDARSETREYRDRFLDARREVRESRDRTLVARRDVREARDRSLNAPRESRERSKVTQRARREVRESRDSSSDARKEVREFQERSLDTRRENRVFREKKLEARREIRESQDRVLEARRVIREGRDRTLEARRETRMSRDNTLYARREIRDTRDRALEARREIRESRDRTIDTRSESRASRDKTLQARKQVRESRDKLLDARNQVRESRERTLNAQRVIIRESGDRVLNTRREIREFRERVLDVEKAEIRGIKNMERDARFRSNSEFHRSRVAFAFTGQKTSSENKPPAMNWQYIFNALQGIYVCGLLIQMLSQKESDKKSRGLAWFAAPRSIVKVD